MIGCSLGNCSGEVVFCKAVCLVMYLSWFTSICLSMASISESVGAILGLSTFGHRGGVGVVVIEVVVDLCTRIKSNHVFRFHTLWADATALPSRGGCGWLASWAWDLFAAFVVGRFIMIRSSVTVSMSV